MTKPQLLGLAVALIGTFLVSVAAGAVVGRLTRPSATSLGVAVATPSPTLVVEGPVSAGPTSTPQPTPTLAPDPTTVPVATPTPAPSPTAGPALDPPTAADFALALSDALAVGDSDYAVARVHPDVIERYGQQTCNRYVRAIEPRERNWEVLDSTGPAPWTWTTDGMDTVIEDAWTVTIRQPGADPEQFEVHFAPFEGTWRWFTDCGSPR